MKRILFFFVMAGCASAMQRVSGYCMQGNNAVVTNSVSSTTLVQRSFPRCTVTVYATGTLTPSTIYSDNMSTSLSNPFVAAADGSWFFYAANGRYDVTLSGGNGGGIPAPFTIGDILLQDAGGGGFVTSVTGSSGVSCTPTSGSVVCSNTGVTSAVAGTGIGVSGATGAVTFSNTGVTSATAGTGIGVSASTGGVTFSNTGVTSIVAGTNITVSGATGAVTVNATGGGSSLPSASNQLTYLRVEPNSGNLTTFQWAGTPTVSAADYNWSQSPSGTLSAGSNTITLTPCPLGVSGTDAAHYVYVSTVGTAESGLITGGTCPGDGVTTGTIIVTLSNSHSAGYTIGSATLGMQEAENALGSGGGHIKLGPLAFQTSGSTVHATTTFPNPTWLEGSGRYISYINVDSTLMTASTVLNFTSSGMGQATDLEIVYANGYTPTAGFGIALSAHESTAQRVIISGLGSYGANTGITCASAGVCRIIDVDIYEPKVYGVQSGTASLYALHSSVTCGDPNQCTAGFHIVGGNTVWMDSVSTEQGQSGIMVDITAASGGLGDAYFNHIVVDNATANGVYLKCSSSCTTGGDLIAFNGGYITTASAVSANGFTVDSGGVSNAWTNIDIRNFNVISQSGAQASILLKGVTHGVIANNMLTSADNSAGTAINMSVNPDTDIQIVGNLMMTDERVGTTCSANALFMDTAAHADVFVDGNRMCAGTATITNTNTGGALQVTLANQMTLGPPTVASASALAVPPDPVFFLSGTTNVTSFTQLASARPREFVIIPTNASPGTIACRATLSPTQYQRISVTWDGSNVYCH